MIKTNTILEGEHPQARQSLQRFFWRTLIVLIVLVSGLVAITVLNYLAYSRLYDEYAALKKGTEQLHACLERKRTLKEEATDMQKRLGKINAVADRPKNPAELLHLLNTLAGTVNLDEIVLKKKQLDLTLTAPTMHAVLTFADQLRAHAFGIEITSIEQAHERIKALMHITVP